MLYTFDKTNVKYRKITARLILIAVASIITLSGLFTLYTLRNISKVKFISEETKAIILKESDKKNIFSRDRLKEYILELNIRYPHIVMAQAELETGGFKSNLFKENNNLFGMKVATQRPTTNKGEENGHAFYDSWRESVVDYAFYSAQYLSDIKSEKEYLEYLKQSYAQDTNYIVKIKRILSN